ncbi:PKHD-type hydroxylase [Limimaricola variabilis]|uniref:PKHD-type hydroxylase n=1 Tax=Limimaricola variabilis TaxID=1492771 RepID=A0ABR6HKV8_9RHOB|nr:Fe2+-dependent dioxygenase [Limimaricola variabilis]MBB3711132.1 PKHD-type hydroxylase [Limimaricola variabilis]
MLLAIDGLLSAPEVEALRASIDTIDFADGRASAGRYAREVKANDQAAPSPARNAVLAKVEKALGGNALFQAAARPARMTPLILSRYRQGQTYGLHVDDALMQGIRTDISFTLFLSEPESYDGGELVIEDGFESRAVKLPAGGLMAYPSTTLHRVAPVTRGTRLAVVGWVQSRLRDAAQREMLFDLDRAVREIHAREGKSELFDLLAKSRSNLLRMWAD